MIIVRNTKTQSYPLVKTTRKFAILPHKVTCGLHAGAYIWLQYYYKHNKQATCDKTYYFRQSHITVDIKLICDEAFHDDVF